MEAKWKKELNRERHEEFEAFLAECCETSRGAGQVTGWQASHLLVEDFKAILGAYEEFADGRNVAPPVRLSPAKLGRELTVFFRKETTRHGLRYYGLRVNA